MRRPQLLRARYDLVSAIKLAVEASARVVGCYGTQGDGTCN
jgi:hypothetical protein